MLNLTSDLSDADFETITQTIRVPDEKDERFAFEEADFRDIFLGSIVFHDWGKTKIDREVLNTGRLKPAEFKDVKKHAIRTVDILISRIFDGIDPDIGMGELVAENRQFRESNNEAGYLLDEIDKLIAVGKIRELVGIALSGHYDDEQTQLFDEAVRAICKVDPFKKWDLEDGMESLNEAVKSGGKDLVEIAGKQLKNLLDKILDEDIVVDTSTNTISVKNTDEAKDLGTEMHAITDADLNERSAEARKHRNRIEDTINSIKKTNREPMKGIQDEIKRPINDVLLGGGHPEAKKILLMAYIAVSHHYSNKGYPFLEDMSGILPDYETWFDSSGEEQATVLAILDVCDAMRSERPYKKALPEVKARKALTGDFLRTEEGKKYKKIVDLILSRWEDMQRME